MAPAELALRRARLQRLLAHAREHSAFYRERIPARDRARPDPGARQGRDDGALRRSCHRPRAAPRHAARVARDADAGRALRGALPRHDVARPAARACSSTTRAAGRESSASSCASQRGAASSLAPAHAHGDRARLLAHAHECAGLGHAVGRRPPRAGPVRRRAIEEQVAALNRFRPHYLNAYPSAAMRLAEEQEAGRLRIAAMSTSSELRTHAMTDRLAETFGVAPFDVYATTEGLFGAECDATTASTCSTTRAWSRTSTRTAARCRRHAGRARARDQPPQPRAADRPARDLRRDDHAPGAVPVRAVARPRGRDRRPPRRRALAARRAAARSACCRRTSRSSRRTARCASSRSARSPAACACSWCRATTLTGASRRGSGAVARALGDAGAAARVEVERRRELARKGGKLQIVHAQPG